jgi:hypothetical protein
MLFSFIAGLLELIENLGSRNELLRVGFGLLRAENIVLRRRLLDAENENRRLSNIMYNFKF